MTRSLAARLVLSGIAVVVWGYGYRYDAERMRLVAIALLALACDLVLAHEGAELGFPDVRLGFVPAMVMTMLRRAVGEKHAADLVMTGRIVSAEEAERIGLVSRVVPAASFDEDINATLEQVGRSPATSLALTKWLFYKLDALTFEDGIAAGVVTNVEARATEDFKAGVARFARDGREDR